MLSIGSFEIWIRCWAGIIIYLKFVKLVDLVHVIAIAYTFLMSMALYPLYKYANIYSSQLSIFSILFHWTDLERNIDSQSKT